MKLDDHADPAQLWQYAERYLGVGTRAYSQYSADLDIDDAYHPQRGPLSFALPTFWVPYDSGEYLTNTIGSRLHSLYQRDDCFLLPVHPETFAMAGLADRELLLKRCRRGPVLEVVPSANARTTFVCKMDGAPVAPHFLKLHFPKRSSRFTRRLRRPIISLQLWVSDELAAIEAPYLPEVGGGVVGHDRREAWGFLLREPRPRHEQSLRYTVPLFALYGQDYWAPSDPTLLEQMIVRSGESPTVFTAERIVRPMVRLWVTVALATGCALEMHGQNTLFTFSVGGATNIMYRDCGVYVDPAVRQARGARRQLPEINVISRDVEFPREQVFSLAYDSFMGHHVFSFIASLAKDRLGVNTVELQNVAREEFASVEGSADLLPKTVYYYDSTLHPDGGWQLVDTGEPAEWR